MTGRWCHFEVWVPVGDGPDSPTIDTLDNMFDTLAEFIFAAEEDLGFNARLGWSTDSPPPDEIERLG